MADDCAIELKSWALIKISGDNAESFLQGQLTCDVTKLSERKSSLAAVCNHQGRILAIATFFKSTPDYFCFLPAAISDQFITHLNKFAVFSKVFLEDVTGANFLFGLVGEKNSALLNNIFDTLPTQPLEMVQQKGVIVCAVPGIEPRYLVYGPIERESIIRDSIKMTGANENLWRKISILSGIPTLYSNTEALFTPHMLNLHLHEAVSFNKGCYVGQEIIARTQYLGKSKRHLYSAHLTVPSTLCPGDVLSVNGQEVGTIVDAISDAEQTLLLAVIQDTAINEEILCHQHTVTDIRRFDE